MGTPRETAPIIVGRVRKAHGVRGDLVVEPLTDDPDAVFSPGRRLLAGTTTGDPARDGGELHIVSANPFKGGFIVHFTGIDDRDVAEKWRERFLLLPADELEDWARARSTSTISSECASSWRPARRSDPSPRRTSCRRDSRSRWRAMAVRS